MGNTVAFRGESPPASNCRPDGFFHGNQRAPRQRFPPDTGKKPRGNTWTGYRNKALQPSVMFGVTRPALRKKRHGRHPGTSERKRPGYIHPSRKEMERRRRHRRAVPQTPAYDGFFPTTMDGNSRNPSRYERYHRAIAWKHDVARCWDSIDVPFTGLAGRYPSKAPCLLGQVPAISIRKDGGCWHVHVWKGMHDDAVHDGRIHARLPAVPKGMAREAHVHSSPIRHGGRLETGDRGQTNHVPSRGMAVGAASCRG